MTRTMISGKALERAPSSTFTHTTAWALPPALFRQATRRLHMFCLLYACVFVAAYFLPVSLFGGLALIARQPVETGSAVISIAFSLFVFLWTRRQCCTPGDVLNLALVYEVVACFGISITEFWGFLGPSKNPMGLAWDSLPFAGLSWVCVVVAVFPLVVPGTPRKVILGALFAASTGPAVILMSMALGASPRFPARALLLLFLPNYLCAGLAYISASIIYRLGADVTRARELGSYRLVELLGKGGMGEVWRARHRMLVRQAAVKLVRFEALGSAERPDAVLQRFEREAQTTATLHSPHTIQIYDFGATDDGSFYYVMEFLTGLDLESLVRQFGPVRQERMVFMLKQVCHSLMEAHEKCLIHRDIKPANIYACRYGLDFDFIKVLDFGLVRSNDALFQEDDRITLEGRAYGTPAYMAPEMALGKTDIDARADIYSLGCVAYWLVTGRRLFETRSAMGMVIDHVKTPPPRPSTHTEMELSADVEAIILACLEKDPANRPQSARALLQALDDAPLARPWTSETASRWWQLHQPQDHGVAQPADQAQPILSPREDTGDRQTTKRRRMAG